MPEKKYLVIITRTVQKALSKLPNKIASKLESAMLKLEDNPRPPGCKKLKGREAYRIREGDYRIIYEIEDKVLRVIIVDVGNRKDIYQD
jgi:mRNA interferase RelE/StbE